MEIKFSYLCVGFLLLGFLVSGSQANDISLALRNKQYIPPPIQELPINHNYYNVQDDIQQQHHFEENNYVNSRYQIFKVQNPFKSSTSNSENNQRPLNVVKSSYSPAQKVSAEKIRIEHINAPADFSLDDPNFDASYLSLATESDAGNRKMVSINEKNINSPESFPFQNLHNSPEKSNKKPNSNNMQHLSSQRQSEQYAINLRDQGNVPEKSQTQEYSKPIAQDQQSQQDSVAKRPNYLPPQQLGSDNTPFKADTTELTNSNYLPPQKEAHRREYLPPQNNFNGPNYLPPVQENSGQQNKQPPRKRDFSNETSFKGSGYLPPQQHISSHSYESFEQNTVSDGPSYLPPQKQSESNYVPHIQLKDINYHHKQSHQSSYNRSEFSPPQTNLKDLDSSSPQQQKQKFQFSNNDLEYMPSQTKLKDPNYSIPSQRNSAQQQNKMLSPSVSYKGPDYLPPRKSEETNAKFNTTDYFPPHQQQHATSKQLITSSEESNYNPNKSLQDPDYTSQYNSLLFKSNDYFLPLKNVQQHQQEVQDLPPGYDFQKPSNAEQAIEELHKLPEESPILQIQVTELEPFSAMGRDRPKQAESVLSERTSAGNNNFQKRDNSEQTTNPLHNEIFTTNSQKTESSKETTNALNNVNSRQQHDGSVAKHISYNPSHINLLSEHFHKNSASGEQSTNESQKSYKTNQDVTTQTRQGSQSNDHQTNPAQTYQGTGQHFNSQSQNHREDKQVSQAFKAPNSVFQITQPSLQLFESHEYLLPTTESSNFLPTTVSPMSKGPSHLAPTRIPETFMGPGYLPPTYGPQTLKRSDYLPPLIGSRDYKAPDYLPPTIGSHTIKRFNNPQPTSTPQSSKDPYNLPPVSASQTFMGSDYPPNTDSHIYNSPTASQIFKGPDYLPPTTTPQSFNGREYLPPASKTQTIKDSSFLVQNSGTQNYKRHDHSPPIIVSPSLKDTNYVTPSTTPNSLRSSDVLSPSTGSEKFKDSNYFQFNSGSQNYRDRDYSPPTTAPQVFKGPDYLPPTSGSQTLKDSINNLPPNTDSHSYKGFDNLTPTTGSQTFKEPDYLPPNNTPQPFLGSDYFVPNFGPQTSLKSSVYFPPATITQNYNGPSYLPPTTESPTFKSSNYLPPTNTPQAFNGGSQNYKEPDYFLPAASKQISVSLTNQQVPEMFKDRGFLPRTIPTNTQELAADIMHILNGYMTTEKPSDTNGNRRQFAEHLSSPTKMPTFSTSNNISPTDRQPSSTDQYYAPTMSQHQITTVSNQNQYQSTAAVSQQSSQVLQNVMPDDVRPTINASTALQNTKPSKGKIRTVQIFDPNTVKTLKILESLDHAGIKTIEILGPSHRQPIGDHRTVKVLNGSHDQSLHTIKIFNDQQDIANNENEASDDAQSNSYLSARTKRNASNKTKAKVRHNI